jgi:hypothetical protein
MSSPGAINTVVNARRSTPIQPKEGVVQARECHSLLIRPARSTWTKPLVPIHDSARRCRFFCKYE